VFGSGMIRWLGLGATLLLFVLLCRRCLAGKQAL